MRFGKHRVIERVHAWCQLDVTCGMCLCGTIVRDAVSGRFDLFILCCSLCTLFFERNECGHHGYQCPPGSRNESSQRVKVCLSFLACYYLKGGPTSFFFLFLEQEATPRMKISKEGWRQEKMGLGEVVDGDACEQEKRATVDDDAMEK